MSEAIEADGKTKDKKPEKSKLLEKALNFGQAAAVGATFTAVAMDQNVAQRVTGPKEYRIYSSLDKATVEREKAAFDLVEQLDAIFKSNSTYQKEDAEAVIANYISGTNQGDIDKRNYVEGQAERLETISAKAVQKLGEALIALTKLSQTKRAIDPSVVQMLSRTSRVASEALLLSTRNTESGQTFSYEPESGGGASGEQDTVRDEDTRA